MPALEILFVSALSFLIGTLPISRLAWSVSNSSEGESRIGEALKVFLDIGKGFGVVYATHIYFPNFTILALNGVFLGHVFPVFPYARGGNGLGTMLGALIALEPTLGLIALTAWTFGFFVFQMADDAALVSAVATMLAALFLLQDMAPLSPLSLLPLFLFVLWRLKSRIVTILFGDEGTGLSETAHD